MKSELELLRAENSQIDKLIEENERLRNTNEMTTKRKMTFQDFNLLRV
jgi:hypothetical protein